MDFSKITGKVQRLLFTPKSEWPKLAAEPSSVAGLYTGYILWLAAIPPIFTFIKGSLFGYEVMGVHFRQAIGAGLGQAILSYALSLVLVFVLALIVDALAPSFGGQKNRVQALKAVGYGWTAAWIAGIATIIPWLGWLILIAGGIYSIYLLYLGLPHTMQCPRDKAAGYTAVTVLLGVVMSVIIGWIVGSVFTAGAAGIASSGEGTVITTEDGTSIRIDEDNPFSAMIAAGMQAEQAAKAAQENAGSEAGASEDAAAAAGMAAAMAALSGNQAKVPAMAPSDLQKFAPDSLDGLPRVSLGSAKQGTASMQFSSVTARYRSQDGARQLELHLVDTARLSGMMGLARAFGGEQFQQSEHGFEKRYVEDGHIIEEEWNNRSGSEGYGNGSYSITVGDRFKVEISGDAEDIDQLKAAVDEVDTDKLAEIAAEAAKG